MKRLIYISAVLLTLTTGCLAQSNIACPKISVVGPSGAADPGVAMPFVASVSGDLAPPAKYEWSVDGGSIKEGQGTPSVAVVGDEDARIVKVTVKLTSGLSPECANSASEVVYFNIPEGEPIDRWGYPENLTPNEKRSRLDTFFAEVINNPNNTGLVVLGVIDKERQDAKNPRVRFIVRHARLRKFDLTRLIFGLESSGQRTTTVWRFSPGARLPCKGCVFIKARDVK